MTQSIALAHGSLTSDGGAERVVLELARHWNAPIYAAVVDHDWIPDDVEAHQVLDSRWARFFESERGKPGPIYWALKHLYRAERLSWIDELYDFDTVVVTKDEMSWWVPRADQTVVRYVHSTPRRLYDQHHRRGQSAVTRMWSTFMRALKEPRNRYADVLVANSDVVRHRIDRYWRVDNDRVRTVYPPVEVSRGDPAGWETQDYLLCLGRLAQNKRIDLLTQVAEHTDRRIVVAGDGPERDRLKDAPANVDYLGYIDEDEKWKRLSQARATLMLAESEDFGIVPVESMAAGTPVVGVAEGMTQHQIQHGINGVLCEPSVTSVYDAIECVYRDGVEWSPKQIQYLARQFGADKFRSRMDDVVEQARQRTGVDPQVEFGGPERVVADGGDDESP